MQFKHKTLIEDAAVYLPPPEAAHVQTVSAPLDTSPGIVNFKDYYFSGPQLMSKAAEYIKGNEGIRYKLYRDTKGKWTIGIGHLVTRAELPHFHNRTLTGEEIEDLFRQDMQGKMHLIAKHFGNRFSQFSTPLKIAIIDGYFRGDLAHSPRARDLLIKGQYQAAADEYLNSDEYRNARASGASGVAKRMERNADIMRREVTSLR